MKKPLVIMCFLFLSVYFLHYIYAACTGINLNIINIEHTFYLFLFLLAAISLSNIPAGKYLLFLLFFWQLSHIYLLPELEKITALESCNEGKCQQAVKMGIVKFNNNRVIYISPKKNKS